MNAGSTGVNAGSTDVLVRIEREARKDLRLRRSTLRKGSTFPASLYFLEMLRLRLNIRPRSLKLSLKETVSQGSPPCAAAEPRREFYLWDADQLPQ